MERRSRHRERVGMGWNPYHKNVLDAAGVDTVWAIPAGILRTSWTYEQPYDSSEME